MSTVQHLSIRKLLPQKIVDSDGQYVDTHMVLDSNVEITCPICLGPLTKTVTIQACLHRFCSECFHRSLRMELGTNSQKECPLCRVKLASRRSSRPDTELDKLIDLLSSKSTTAYSNSQNQIICISSNFYEDMKYETFKLPDNTDHDINDSVVEIEHEPSIDLSEYRRAYEDSIKTFRQKQLDWKNDQNRVNSSTNRQQNNFDNFSTKKMKISLFPRNDSQVL